MLAIVPSNDINDVLTRAKVLGDVAVRFSMELGGLIKNKKDLKNVKCHFLLLQLDILASINRSVSQTDSLG